MVAINEKYIPRKADKSGPQNPTVAWQGKKGCDSFDITHHVITDIKGKPDLNEMAR